MRYTAAQVGAAATPEAHAANVLPPGVSETRDDDKQPANFAPREGRSWRAVAWGAHAPGPATDAQMGSLPSAHTGTGSPDPRAVWGGTAGHTGPTLDSLRPAPEVLDNSRTAVAVAPLAAPDRPRAGSTGADPARPAWMPRWLFFRPFDAWAQYGAASVDKIEQASPVASRPLAFAAALADAEPYAGGSGATDMAPWADSPNTVRYLPQPWDAQVTTDNETPSTSHAAAQRARGWGLR